MSESRGRPVTGRFVDGCHALATLQEDSRHGGAGQQPPARAPAGGAVAVRFQYAMGPPGTM
jgi:hypothetical protein